jgi:hypothetical protein
MFTILCIEIPDPDKLDRQGCKYAWVFKLLDSDVDRYVNLEVLLWCEVAAVKAQGSGETYTFEGVAADGSRLH